MVPGAAEVRGEFCRVREKENAPGGLRGGGRREQGRIFLQSCPVKADIANPISDFVYRGIHADSDLLNGFRREGGGFHKDLPPFSE